METFVSQYNLSQSQSQANVPNESTNSKAVISENNLSLVVLMGLPACGKSTFANKLSQVNCERYTIVMSYDNYVPLSVQAKISGIFESVSDNSASTKPSYAKILRKKFIYCVETLSKFVKTIANQEESKTKVFDSFSQDLNTLLNSYESNDLVSNESFITRVQAAMHSIMNFYLKNVTKFRVALIIDDNNYYYSMRNDFYQVAKQLEVGFCLVHCKSSLKTCLKRNSERSTESQVPHKVIVEMSIKFEDPNPLHNVADMFCIQINLDDQAEINLPVLEHVISNSFGNPLKKSDRTEEIEKERRLCSENEVHQADLLLRKWINKKLNLKSLSNSFGKASSSTGICKKTLSKELNDRKKKVLEKLKSGELKVSYRVDQEVEFHEEIKVMFENLLIE